MKCCAFSLHWQSRTLSFKPSHVQLCSWNHSFAFQITSREINSLTKQDENNYCKTKNFKFTYTLVFLIWEKIKSMNKNGSKDYRKKINEISWSIFITFYYFLLKIFKWIIYIHKKFKGWRYTSVKWRLRKGFASFKIDTINCCVSLQREQFLHDVCERWGERKHLFGL